MKRIIYFSLLFILFSACDKEDETIVVQYNASNGYSETQIKYRDADGVLVSKDIVLVGGEDIWTYSFDANKGDIVYLSARYFDPNSSVTLQILLDGKIYKESTSNNETDKYLTISGTIPYYTE
ncbi:MAG: hypothetical protein DRJ05_06440 [Bacteroidetes bacterium]|nr:MAG: hypothetical protein DRJ05_06440 [Bacteroidota bacterium]